MGGAARHLAPFLAALGEVRPGWSVQVWVTEGHEPHLVAEDVVVRVVPRFGVARRLWWESVELPRALSDEKAHALVNLTNSGPLRCPVPSLLYQRNALPFDRAWVSRLGPRARALAAARRALFHLQMCRSAATVVPSASMADHLLGWRGAPAGAVVRIVPHGVDVGRFSSTERSWPPVGGRPLQLVSVSHAARHKDQVLLVGLVAGLRDAGHDVRLWLTVDRQDSPAYVAEIDQARARLEVGDRVEVLGRVDDVERLYRRADVMVFPSLVESFGFPVVEAMAAGIPVVASRIASTEELLGPDGWYFEPGDVQGAVAAVRRLLATPGSEVVAATDRASAAADRLSWSTNAAAVVAVVEEVTGSTVG